MSKTEKTLKTSNSAEVNWSRGVERGQKGVKKGSKRGQKEVKRGSQKIKLWLQNGKKRSKMVKIRSVSNDFKTGIRHDNYAFLQHHPNKVKSFMQKNF